MEAPEVLVAKYKDRPLKGYNDHRYAAMIEAMDTEIGRVLDSMDPEVRDNTYVIFVGDNGSVLFPGSEERTPFQRGKSKGSVYQGGVHVPFVITGPGVARGRKISERWRAKAFQKAAFHCSVSINQRSS